jgi:hypothetical protein
MGVLRLVGAEEAVVEEAHHYRRWEAEVVAGVAEEAHHYH